MIRGLLIDMNLSPSWVQVLERAELASVHWSTVGATDAPDATIMRYALQHDLAVFTNDLDFGTLLALTNATGPSCVQLRTQQVDPAVVGDHVVHALRSVWPLLELGALVTIDLHRARATVLPFRQEPSG